ncbi:MAG: cupin domain-containing protein [Actinomycetota bacterium]|nr:MAG: cupin domain-containing protein [Actinomycetota bacterium]
MSDSTQPVTRLDDVESLVAVQPDSTLSRVVLQAPGARVVLFAFDAGQELTEHTASVPVLLQVLSGELEVSAGGETFDLRPGGLAHLEGKLAHSVVAREPTVLQLTMLQPQAG